MKGKRRFHPGPQPILESLHLFAKIRLLAVVFFQCRLMVPKINMAGSPSHEQLHDAPGAGRVMKHSAKDSRSPLLATERVLGQHGRECHRSQAARPLLEKLPARGTGGFQVFACVWHDRSS